MAELEIEGKYALPGGSAEAAALEESLLGLGARLTRHRHLEENRFLDFADGMLRRRGCGLRVRVSAGECSLTWKGPVRPDSRLKIREEIILDIADPEKLVDLLGRVGLRVIFRFQKFRTEYRLAGGPAVTVDETPCGWYTELEGSEEEIVRAAAALGLAGRPTVRESYAGLLARELERQGRGAGTEVLFPPERLAREAEAGAAGAPAGRGPEPPAPAGRGGAGG